MSHERDLSFAADAVGLGCADCKFESQVQPGGPLPSEATSDAVPALSRDMRALLERVAEFPSDSPASAIARCILDEDGLQAAREFLEASSPDAAGSDQVEAGEAQDVEASPFVTAMEAVDREMRLAEAADLSSWMNSPHLVAVDAKGYVWRAYLDVDYWSMAPVNPDNSPVPEPITYYAPIGTGTRAGAQAINADAVERDLDLSARVRRLSEDLRDVENLAIALKLRELADRAERLAEHTPGLTSAAPWLRWFADQAEAGRS